VNTRDLVLIGAGGHARACIEAIESQGEFNIVGLVGLEAEVGNTIKSYKVLDTDSNLSKLAREIRFALVCIGQIPSPHRRIDLFRKAQSAGFTLASVVASSAYVAKDVRVGEGTIIMHGAIINAGAVIGDNCIINSRALIEHDSKIESHSHVSTGAIINGNVFIGSGSFVGSGAILKQGIEIGPGSVIGMSTSVDFNLPPSSRIVREKIR
jgi:sugar O-acyltransferase (sialic acid O-acetyltransferase NeuD family)